MEAPSEALFLAQIIFLLLAGRLIGEAMQRIGQPAVMGQLIAGMVLGPSVLGAIWPAAQHAIFAATPRQETMLDAVSQIGILMLLLLTGMETDLKLVRQAGRAALSTSVAGIALPFACGFALGELLPDAMLPNPNHRVITALFLGTALSIASLKIVAVVVREMGFMRRNVGMTLIASAIIDDTAGWVIIAITIGLAAQGRVDAVALGQIMLETAVFLAASFTVGRPIIAAIIRWTNDHFVSEMPVVTAVLVIMATMALLTELIGVHTMLGAFVAGILVGESPILTRHIEDQLRGLVVAFFMPVFFSLAGLHADLSILRDPNLALLTVGLILIASLGKFLGAFLGGRFGGLSARESLALGCGMNARGSTEVIVASIGLSMGALSPDLFTMVVAMAVVTTMAMPPTLRWALSRLPFRDEEQARLEREAFAARGFVTNIERFLVAADGGTNGRLALHLAALLAQSHAIPTTILHLKPRQSSQQGESLAAVVAREARKGYGFLLIGLENTAEAPGSFHEEITDIAACFGGPFAIVVARGAHLDAPPDNSMNILVPVRGNEASRRGAEVALALAHADGGTVTALYVMGTVGLGAPERRPNSRSQSHRYQDVILRDIVELAARYDTPIHTALRLDIAPEDAILRQARLGKYDLIVMGVGRPAGERLYFGKIAAAALEKSRHSMLFVSS
jgi:Kef-type K+ transport system membrane component KefB/nucleotide-binding universal stress UspA family protein